MRRILTIAIVLATILISNNSFAQKQYKFGHVDSNELLSMMPERATAKTELESYAKQLENTLMSMQTELEKKYQEYQTNAESLSPIIRQTKESELQEMQQRMQTFQQSAQQDLSQKENELLQPIIAKARKAIDEVAEEGGYIYIFDIGSGTILHHSSDSEDILPLVKAKLGIQ
jgi:outer membrane protein